jgi:hypothetical protein
MTRSYHELIPSIERRLSAWVTVSDRRALRTPADRRPTITISRQFGCEGFPLAEQLEARFESLTGEDWTIYDKALLEVVSDRDRLAPSLLEGLGDPARQLGAFAFLVPGYVPQSRVFDHVKKHMVQVADAGNAIIIGRGGAIITQKMGNCFHFRLVASLDFRVASMAKRLEITEAEALKLVRINELARENFIQECLGASPADASYYDAVFNNARHGVHEIANAIVAYVSAAWKKQVETRLPLAG